MVPIFLANRSFCSARSTRHETDLLEDRDPDDASRVRLITWTVCTREHPVELLRAEGGGHAVPSFAPVSGGWRKHGGGHNRDTESAEEA